MDIQESLNTINKHFKYKKDTSRFDTWSIMDTEQQIWEGDCEDYSLTVIWLYSDKSFLKFLWNIVSFKFIMWHVKVHGEGHIVTKFGDQYFDNIQMKLVPKEKLINQGYKFVVPFIFPAPFIKLAFSKIIKAL